MSRIYRGIVFILVSILLLSCNSETEKASYFESLGYEAHDINFLEKTFYLFPGFTKTKISEIMASESIPDFQKFQIQRTANILAANDLKIAFFLDNSNEGNVLFFMELPYIDINEQLKRGVVEEIVKGFEAQQQNTAFDFDINNSRYLKIGDANIIDVEVEQRTPELTRYFRQYAVKEKYTCFTIVSNNSEELNFDNFLMNFEKDAAIFKQ